MTTAPQDEAPFRHFIIWVRTEVRDKFAVFKSMHLRCDAVFADETAEEPAEEPAEAATA